MIQFENKTTCCGCFACEAKCPVHAISRKADEFGNEYPIIDQTRCISCGMCDKVCPLRNSIEQHESTEVYAAVVKDQKQLLKSASGGVFYALAKTLIEKKQGVVYGCAYNEEMMPEHERIDDVQKLERSCGSKYVRSSISVSLYEQVNRDLKDGKDVLFSGTPCQCAAVKQFCKRYDQKLYTVELICHGVIDQTYWRDYVSYLSQKHKGRISDFSFRYKREGTSAFTASYVCKQNKHGRTTEKRYYASPSTSYYYHHFLKGYVFREACYECKFAQSRRVSDLTIGDFWGYQGSIEMRKGISAVLVCTKKGQHLLDLAAEELQLEKRTFEEVAAKNEQLRHPFDISCKNYQYLSEWKKDGVESIARKHVKRHWKAYTLKLLGKKI